MAFTPELAPTDVGDIKVFLISNVVWDPETAQYLESKRVKYEVSLLGENHNQVRFVTGDLQPHLTQAQIDGLVAFVDAMRVLAQGLIPSTE